MRSLGCRGKRLNKPCGFRSLPYRTRTPGSARDAFGASWPAKVAKYVPQPLLGLLTGYNGSTCIRGPRSHYRHSDRSAR